MSVAGGDVTLALDASTYRGTVAVVRGGETLAEETVQMRGADEERLLPAVRDVLDRVGLAPSGIRRIACGAGPGSFTSLRIAGSIAKGLAVATGAELLAVPSLLLVAAGAPEPLPAGRYLALLDAMRDERFAAVIEVGDDGAYAVRREARPIPAAAAAERCAREGLVAIGPGESSELWPHARGVARLAGTAHLVPVSLDDWEPDYGRLAEAQVKWEAAHGRPLTVARAGP